MAAEKQVTVLDLMAQASASTPGPGATMPAAQAPPPDEGLVERVERLTAAVEQIPDPRARAVAEELFGAVLELYGEGLERVMELVDEHTARAMAGDGAIASLLLIHDLYPVSLEERVLEALEGVRPYMESHGGGVELLSLEDGVARLRLEGSCKGCPASSATLELAIEKALEEAAPDLLGLEVEGVTKPPEGPIVPGVPLPLAPVPDWTEVAGLAQLPAGAHTAVKVEDRDLFVANVDGTLLAYSDLCPSCGSALAGGEVAGGILGCPSCAVTYDLPRAGRAVGRDDLQLGPVPLLREGPATVRVALR
ncbi:MAG: NifU family protein [Thermoleophilaceae bacterium]|nr:NifU family protein [Thermoleophilaceae bacterium]